jgi:hypothetical protein
MCPETPNEDGKSSPSNEADSDQLTQQNAAYDLEEN